MSYKIWFNQTLPDTVQRKLKTGFLKSGRAPKKIGGPMGCTQNELVEGLWNSASRIGDLAEPSLHEELDRLMERIRPS
jgi:hypothetical protein